MADHPFREPSPPDPPLTPEELALDKALAEDHERRLANEAMPSARPAKVLGLCFGGTLALFATLMSCGDRTGLLVDAVPVVDAAPDLFVRDVRIRDRAVVQEEDALEEEALPPLDVQHHDVIGTDCVDAGSTLIYVVGNNNDLLSFYPPTAQFNTIGAIACPSASMPFSMAVTRKGTAYVVFYDSTLFRISTATSACVATPFVTGQAGFSTFGMGYVADPADGGETLYIAGDMPPSGTLATIDTTTFTVAPIGTFFPVDVNRGELTGTGDGRLFTFYGTNGGTDSAIAQIDPKTAQVIASSPLPGVAQGQGWAFAFWGGDFYTFTAPGDHTVVTRFRPSDNSITQVAQTAPGTVIVGAGVSTCAPE
jgi:hypothetical protein